MGGQEEETSVTSSKQKIVLNPSSGKGPTPSSEKGLTPILCPYPVTNITILMHMLLHAAFYLYSLFFPLPQPLHVFSLLTNFSTSILISPLILDIPTLYL
jgi:hypothetical protein